LIKESRRLRRNLFTQGDIRHLSDEDFQNYKSASINNCIRSKADLISLIPNDIDGVVDLDVLNNLKNFSFKIKDLEERIVELTATVAATATQPTQPSLSKPSSAVTGNLEDLTKKIAEYIDEIMPPQFIQSMLILPKDQLHKYKLNKIVLHEYNEYIQETCQVVDDISNRLSMHVQSYSYIKNIKRKSRNSFPSFKNKLNEILLKHSNEFGFEEKEPS
jgi:CHAT domain-containing protein